MGLLNSNTLNQWFTQTLPQNARNLWGEIKQAPQDIRQLISPEMNTQVRQQMNKPATLDRNAAMGMAMDYLQTTNPMGGLLAHTVYHGSPHKFNKFDMSKIGTGEGAQAYGHGLYFAESPGVAKSYVANPGGLFTVKGKTYGDLQKQWGEFDKPTRRALTALADSQGNADEAIGNLKGMITPESNQAAYVLKQWVDSGDVLKNTGNMYKVDIPDEAIPRMLDWDRSLDQQSKEVRDAFMQMVPKPGTSAYYDDLLLAAPSKQGGYEYKAPLSRFYEAMARGSHADLSQKLKQQGIPGIKYLDGTSRGAGDGTRNFVLFDDQMPRILEINGQPTGLLSWADEAKKAKKK